MRPRIGLSIGGPVVAEAGVRLGRPTWGPSSLLRDLELRLGLASADDSAATRVPSWVAAIKSIGDRNAFYRRSFDVDELGTAKALLEWREWRELHAFAAYTYLRPGELRTLTWSAIDLENGIIHVSCGWHYASHRVKTPKSWSGVREVPVHPELAPMLHRMRTQRGVTAHDLVVPVIRTRSPHTLAWRLRRHLWSAGVRRPELHESTLTRVRAGFRSWRDSGITWSAIVGVGLAQIMRRAGHEDVATTMRYVKLAEDLRGALGRPFRKLPRELVSCRSNG